jgi:hypothetical protein
MSDDENAKPDEGTETPTEGETPEQESERRYAKSEHERIVKREVAKAARRARQKALAEAAAQREPTTDTPEAPANGDSGMEARLRALEEEGAFKDALLSLPTQVTEEQRSLLRRLFDPKNPSMIRDDYDAIKGDKDTPAEPAADAAKPEAPAAVPSPVPGKPPYNPGAPSGSPDEMPSNPLKWSKADYQRLRDRGGRAALDAVEKWRDTLPGGNPGMFRRRAPKG